MIFVVVAGHEAAKIVAAAAAPDDSHLEALRTQRVKDGPHDCLVHRHGQVQVSGSEAAMLGSRPDCERRQDKDRQAVLGFGLAGPGRHHSLGEPGVEVDRQARPLLLGAARRHHRYRALTGKRSNLLVGAVPKAHAPTMTDGRE